MGPLVEVAVAVPVDGTFTYALPEALASKAAPGHRVLVPFGRRKLTGYLLGDAAPPPPGTELREVAELLDDGPILTPPLLALLRWVAGYYQHPLGEVVRTALPPGINVHSERRVRLTGAGRTALEEAKTPVAERELLAVLAARPGGEAVAGGKRSQVDPRLAERLIARGWVARVEAVRGARVKAAFTEQVAATLPEGGLEAAVATLGRAPSQQAVLQWLAARGRVPMEELRAAFPGARDAVGRLAAKGLVALAREVRDRLPEGPAGVATDAGARPEPTAAQAGVLAVLEGALGTGFHPYLLAGVTGSGKTEVYMRLIEAARARGQGALVLVPEIALTPQLVGRFRARFGDDVAVLHSGLSDGERHDEWWRIRRGDARVAVGVRSAIFAPVEGLGVVVVDEEHDGSFKQEEGLRYHARDLALVRGRDASAVVVLGSATPSLESVANVRAGRYGHLTLPGRVQGRPMPRIEVVDLRADRPGHDPETHAPYVLSDPLVAALGATVGAGRQAILFLNRRGHAPTLVCAGCGGAVRCPNCEVGLTLHRRPAKALCHYCGYEVPPPTTCPECGGPYEALGVGTQKVEAEVLARVPGARVARLDRDTTAKKGALGRILADFALGRHDVLVGTQMVAKGHDFPGVTLVGVVAADLGLLVPDFRAAERTFQLLAQVAGRAGRGTDPGRVLIQSWRPEHPAVRLAALGDFAGFSEQALAEREGGWWPPACRLLMARIEGQSSTRVAAGAEALARRAEAAAEAHPEAGLEVLGPAPAPLARLRGRTRWQLLVKAPDARTIGWIGGILRGAELPPGVTAALDVDPVGML